MAKFNKYSVTQRMEYVQDGRKKVQAILKMKRGYHQADMWWSKKFCREILSDPIVRIRKNTFWEDHDYSVWARKSLALLEKKFPEKPIKTKKLKMKSTKRYSRRAMALKSIRKSLRQARELYISASNKYTFWFNKYNKCPLSKPEWKQLLVKKDLCKEECTKLAKEVRRFERKLGLKYSSIESKNGELT